MQIKIPYNRRELKDGTIINNHGEISAVVDMSVNAEEKWEKHFPVLAAKETVFAYTERINATPKKDANIAAIVLSSVKALYCFLESDDLPDFKSFARLFDLSDGETIKKQMNVLETAFGLVNDGSAVTPKN